MKKIVFCSQNLRNFGDEVYQYCLDKYSDKMIISQTRCLGACGDCYTTYMADFHGKLLIGGDAQSLIQAIEIELGKEEN